MLALQMEVKTHFFTFRYEQSPPKKILSLKPTPHMTKFQEEPLKSNNPCGEVRYVSLSCFWGDKNFITALENVESLKAGIPWGKIPQTVKGAISSTRGLGIQYL